MNENIIDITNLTCPNTLFKLKMELSKYTKGQRVKIL